MEIKTEAGQVISLIKKIDDFDWDLGIRFGKKELHLKLTDEEVMNITTDLYEQIFCSVSESPSPSFSPSPSYSPSPSPSFENDDDK